jgi:hypothetical protein
LTLRQAGSRSGLNHLAFSGRAGHLVLRPGSYQATLIARDGDGDRSGPVGLRFTVVKS